MTNKIPIDCKLRWTECCVCLESYPRRMIIPCTTCKYSSCRTCVEKMTIIDTTDDNYPDWGDICDWNHRYKITCPMCRQSMVSRILHLNVDAKLDNWAYQYLTRSSLDWELDWATDGLGGCSDFYVSKVELETNKDWTLSQTPLMKRWLNNHLSDSEIVDNYLKKFGWDGSKHSRETDSAEIIKKAYQSPIKHERVTAFLQKGDAQVIASGLWYSFIDHIGPRNRPDGYWMEVTYH